jgi:hypothetical protein
MASVRDLFFPILILKPWGRNILGLVKADGLQNCGFLGCLASNDLRSRR